MDTNVVAALAGVALGFGLSEAREILGRRGRKKAIAALLFIELKQLMIFIDRELSLAEDATQEMFEPLRTPAASVPKRHELLKSPAGEPHVAA